MGTWVWWRRRSQVVETDGRKDVKQAPGIGGEMGGTGDWRRDGAGLELGSVLLYWILMSESVTASKS
jgi:hypothetical protein